MAKYQLKQEMYDGLLDITQEINSIHDIDELLRKVMDIAMDVLQAERGFIILKEGDSLLEYKIPIARNISRQDIDDITTFSSSVVRRVLSEGESILTYDAQEDDRFKGAESIMINRIRSIAAVPLQRKKQSIGAIYMDSTIRQGKFDEATINFLTAFANQAAIAVENARLFGFLNKENEDLRNQVQERYHFKEMIGQSAAMQKIFDLLQKVIDTDATVLVEGESGTGKELVARALHYHGPRKEKQFVVVFCSAISESLLESELFGHKRGAFTGAKEDKKGLFEVADGGTVFFDEISDISLNIQTKLLRFLQEGEIKRVGDTAVRHMDVRVIAATNKKLYDEVKAGRFREDLYYRLNVIHFQLPLLKERIGDIQLLANHFLKKYNDQLSKHIQGFSTAALSHMESYHWPGNVREMENTIERAVIMASQPYIQLDDLNLEQTNEPLFEPGMSLKNFEKKLVQKTLNETEGNISKAAKILDVSRRWLHYRLKEWDDET